VAAFYQLPKVLVMDEKYQNLSIEAKFLYTLMRDCYKLSIMNNWRDAVGIFIKMTRKTICKLLNRSEPTVRKIIEELKKAGLITEKRVGLTKANKIYVQPLAGENETPLQSKAKEPVASTTKPGFVPERKDSSPNKTNRKQTQFRKLTSKPELPREGDIWEENGQEYVFLRGYTQRHYSADEIDRIVYDPFTGDLALEK